LQQTSRESRILRQARQVIFGVFAAPLGAATGSASDSGQRVELIRLCDETQQIVDTDLTVTDETRGRLGAALAGPTAPRQSADEHDQRLPCLPAHQDNVDRVTIAHLCETVAEQAWK